MSEFHQFSQLPTELRILIWSFATEPRRVHIYQDSLQSPLNGGWQEFTRTDAAPPAVLRVCREARRYAPYVRAWPRNLHGRGHRYIWVNFAVDMICAPVTWEGDPRDPWREELRFLDEHAHDLQRLELRLDSNWAAAAIQKWGRKKACAFPALREVQLTHRIQLELGPWDDPRHMRTLDWIWQHDLTAYTFGPCADENVRFVDAGTGLVLTFPEIYAIAVRTGSQPRETEEIIAV